MYENTKVYWTLDNSYLLCEKIRLNPDESFHLVLHVPFTVSFYRCIHLASSCERQKKYSWTWDKLKWMKKKISCLFFFFAERLSFPESEDESWSESSEEDDDDESELESDAWPEGCSRSTLSAIPASSGSWNEWMVELANATGFMTMR